MDTYLQNMNFSPATPRGTALSGTALSGMASPGAASSDPATSGTASPGAASPGIAMAPPGASALGQLRAALEVGSGFDAARAAHADFLAKSLGVPVQAVVDDMETAELEHQVVRIGQVPALAGFAAESPANAALVRGNEGLVQLAERAARSRNDLEWRLREQREQQEQQRREEAFGAYRQGELGTLEKFRRSYIAGFEDVWDSLRGSAIAGLENPEALARNLTITAFADKDALAGPFAAAKAKAGEIRAAINKEQETRNPPVYTSSKFEQYLLDFTRAVPQTLGTVGLAWATGGAGSSLFIGSQIAGGKYLNLTDRGVEKERALLASMTDAGLQAPLEMIGIGKFFKIFKTSGFANTLKAMGVSGLTEFLTETLQGYPEKATEIWAEAEIMGRTLEESFKYFFDNLGKDTLKYMYEGTVAAPFGFVLGSGRLASQYRHEEKSRQFKEAHVAFSKDLAESPIKQMPPEQAEDLLERMGVDQDLAIQAKDVQELHQSGIDLTPALGVTIEEVRKKAAFGHEFEVRAATLHRHLEPGQAEQVFSHTRPTHAPANPAELQDGVLFEEGVERISAIRKAGIDEEAAYQTERARLHEGFTRAVEAVPGLKAQAEGMAGSVSAYLDQALALADAALPRLAALSGESRASILARIVPQMLGASQAQTPLADAAHGANTAHDANAAHGAKAVAGKQAAGFVFHDTAKGLPVVAQNEGQELHQADFAAFEYGRRVKQAVQKWGEQVKAFFAGTLHRRTIMHLGQTPDILQRVGLPDLPMVMEHNIAKKVTGQGEKQDAGHQLTEAQLAALVEELADPVMVLQASNGYYLAVTDLWVNDAPVMVAIAPDAAQGRIQVNDIRSAYGKDKFAGWVLGETEKGNLLYLNKKRSAAFKDRSGLQLPRVLEKQRSSGKKIIYDNEVVKPEYENGLELHQADFAAFEYGRRVKQAALKWGEQVKAFFAGTLHRRTIMQLGQTPDILQRVGLPDLPMVMGHDIAKKVTGQGKKQDAGHQLTEAQLAALVEELADPAMVLQAPNGYYLAVTDLWVNDAPVMVAIAPDAAQGRIQVNDIRSAYGKDKFAGWVLGETEKGNLLYLNKKRSAAFKDRSGLQLPRVLEKQRSSGKKIIYDNEVVKPEYGNGLELHQALNPEVDLDALVPVVRVEPQFAGKLVHELTKGAIPQRLKQLAGVYTNKATGWQIELTKTGIAHAAGSVGKLKKEHILHMEAVANLPKLIEQAVLVESHADRKESGLAAVHRMYAPMLLGDAVYTVKLTVKEYAGERRLEVEGVYKLYDSAVEKKMPNGALSTAMPEGWGDDSTSGISSGIKIRTLLEGVNDSEGKSFLQDAPPADARANNVVGAITPEIASLLPLDKPGDIILLPEDVRHIEKEHGEQIRGLGYADAREFVTYVLSHVDAVYQGSTNRKFELVARESRPQSRVIAKLEFAREGDHYQIKTAGLVREKYYKNRTPLWERANPTLFQEENPSAARHASQRGQSGEQLNLTTLHAGVKGNTRGVTTLRDGTYYVRLMQRADLSTLPHEFSHVFLLEWQRIMDSGVTDAAARADWQAARKWLGAKEGAAFTRQQHEQFARGFEAYLREGKAPAPELAGTFQRFKRWLLAVYKDAKALGVELDDDIRGVFDRMLATDRRIEEAAALNELHNLTEAQLDALGVTGKDRVYAAGLMDMAKERGRAGMQEDLDRERASRLKAWGAEAAHELAGDRVQAARNELYGKRRDGEDSGPWLDIEAVREGFGVQAVADLRKALGGFSLRKGGQDPELMAARHGFASGAELIGALLVAEPRARRIAALVAEKEAAFEAAHAERMHPAGYILEAEEAAAQVELVGARLAASLGREGIPRQTFALVAAAELSGMPMGKAVAQGPFLAALRRALRDERRAVASGDFAGALEANHKARLNLEFVRQSKDMARLQEKTARQAGSFVGMGKADPDARYLVADIAMRHGFGRYNQALAQGRGPSAMRDWLAARQADGYTLFVDEAVAHGPGKPWKEMTAQEFAALADTITQVAAVERNTRQILTGGNRQALDDAAGAVAAGIRAYRKAPPPKAAEKESIPGRGAAFAHAVHTKIEALCLSLDGGKAHGPVRESVFRPIAEADDLRATRGKEARSALRGSGLFGRYTRKELARMGTDKTFIREIGKALTREQRIAVALNMGNERSYVCLRQGHGWDDAQIAAVVAGLGKKDWDFVQAVWDYIGSFREEAFALHESLTGVRPRAVEARPLVTPHGQYAGGWFPVRYAADASFRAFAREQKAFDRELFGGRNHGAAMAEQAHGRERPGTGAGGPLLLELSVVADHVFNVVHDLSFRKPVMDVAKIVSHPKVRAAIEAAAGKAQYGELRPWLQDLAGTRQEPMHFLHRGARWARTGTTVMQTGYSFASMAAVPLGFTQSVEMLGYTYAGRGLKTVYGNPLRFPEVKDATYAKSAFMAQRLDALAREAGGISKKLHQPGRFAWVDVVRDNAFVPRGIIQLGVDLPTWWGAYEKGLKENGGNEGKAVRYADSVVRLSQGSGAAKDLARIQRGGELARLATMFYARFNTVYNLAALRSAELQRDRSPEAVFRAANSALLLWFVPAVLYELAAGRGPDDGEEPWEWAAEQMLVYPFMTVVGVRDIAGAVSGSNGWRATPAQSAPASLARWFAAVDEALEKREWDGKKLVMATAEAGGYLARLPLQQGITSAGNVWDYLTGDDPDFEVRDLFFTKPKSRRQKP